jgi:hypothetical protein
MNARILRLLVLFLPLLAPRQAAAERWYVYSIAEVPVGYVSEASDPAEPAGFRTRTVVFARLVRLGSSLEMRFDTSVVETAEGELVSSTYEALLSTQPSRLEARVEGDRIRISAPPLERFVERGAAPLLGPAAIARRTAAALRAPGDALDFAMFSPELQRVVRVRRKMVAAADRVACNGATAIKLEETIEGLPAPRTVWVDREGLLVADAVAGPFGAMASCLATREAALAARGELPADLYERTVARSNVRLADASAVDRIVLQVTPRDPAQPLPDFTRHNQTAAGQTIEIRRPAREPGQAEYLQEDLSPNALVQSNDAAVVETAKRLTAADAWATALALTRWVAEEMTFDTGIVMAPASELMRDRKGTCMGYATLLAALARAAGIPSRIAMGYVYYGGIWGGHAWTEMWVDGRWLPFDAAVYAPGIASAARLAVGASSFADGGGELNAALGQLFGRVEIGIVEYEQDGRAVRVPPGTAPFRIDGSTYLNPGLGLQVAAADWAIERADSTWPETLVVAFRRGGTTIELHQKPRHPERPLARVGDAMFTAVDGGTLWVWTATGADAARELQRFLGRVDTVRPPAAGR